MARRADKVLTVLYVGDRDPSGMHMSEVDLPRRLERYGARDFDIEIVRVAIIEEDTLPQPACRHSTQLTRPTTSGTTGTSSTTVNVAGSSTR